jgi:polynucleotide 5'-hydroxyl-kinase GRC3/NOL9
MNPSPENNKRPPTIAAAAGPGSRKRPRPKEEPQFASMEWYSCSGKNNSQGESDDDDENSSVAKLNATVTFSHNTINNTTNECLCLMGRAQIQCLQGSVEIMGYRLDPSHAKVSVESPPWSSLLVFQPIFAEESGVVTIQVESWWPQSAEYHSEPTFELVTSGSAPNVRPTLIPSTWQHAMDLLLPQLPQLAPELASEISKPAFHRSALTLPGGDEDDSDMDNNRFYMAICGAKGVGKSTLLRYATNRILQDKSNAISRIAILDADVGQPEMSPPGLVTLTVISEPFLTPPHYRSMAGWCEQQQQQFGYFFGSVSSKNDPHRYMQLVQRLVQHYEEDVAVAATAKDNNKEEFIPLLINLDGWVKGLGCELLTTMLTEVIKPTHVLQIVGTTKSKQFQLREALNPEISSAQLQVVYSYDSNLNLVSSVPNLNGTNNGFTVAPSTVPARCTMPAPALRNLRLCTYFLNDVTIWYNLGFGNMGIEDHTCEIAHRLAGALPYVVPLEAVDVQWEGSDHFADLCGRQQSASPSQQLQTRYCDLILDALNAKLVGLCCRPNHDGGEEEDSDSPCLCIGLGLVRAIDRAKRLLYILTPVDSNRLKNVNLLVGGTIDIPTEFWFRGVHAEAFPYQSLASPSTSMVGAEPMNSRNNLARRSLGK